MEKRTVLEMMAKHNLKASGQFVDYAIKFNSVKLVEEFCLYWKTRAVGGADLNNFMLQYYKGKLGE